MTDSGKSGVALLVGAGDAIGAAVAQRFAAGGYSVCVARRDADLALHGGHEYHRRLAGEDLALGADDVDIDGEGHGRSFR